MVPQVSTPDDDFCDCAGISARKRFRRIFVVVVELMKMNGVFLGIVGEEFGVAAPVERGFDLLVHFRFSKAFVEKIAKEFHGHGVVGFLLERRVHLLQQ